MYVSVQYRSRGAGGRKAPAFRGSADTYQLSVEKHEDAVTINMLANWGKVENVDLTVSRRVARWLAYALMGVAGDYDGQGKFVLDVSREKEGGMDSHREPANRPKFLGADSRSAGG